MFKKFFADADYVDNAIDAFRLLLRHGLILSRLFNPRPGRQGILAAQGSALQPREQCHEPQGAYRDAPPGE